MRIIRFNQRIFGVGASLGMELALVFSMSFIAATSAFSCELWSTPHS
jgi:hypothetical protein